MNVNKTSETSQKLHAETPDIKVFNNGEDVITTERMRALQALADSESRYRALIETTNTGFVIIDMNGFVLDANHEYVRLTGHNSLDEILGKNVLQWTAPYEKEKNRTAVKTCAEKGSLRDFEVDYVTPGGEIIPIELNATSVEFDGKKQVLTLCRDISSRRKIERKIQESEELFRKVFEDGPQGMILSDSEHRIVITNAAFCRMIQYDETDLLGRSISDFIHPDQLQEVTVNIELRDQGKFNINKIETRYLKKNGETLWASVTVSAIRDTEENFLINLAMVEDISERKKADLALKSSEAMFRRLIEGAPEAIFIQTEGKISFVNTAACVLFGAPSPDDILGADLLERVHPDFREIIRNRINHINTERKENPLLEEIYLRLDGSPVPVEVTAVPVEFEGKNGALVFVRDITERKKTEETLRNTQKLESVGVLAGGIAHDFNNLLSGLFGNLDLARLFIEEGNSPEALETISRAMGVFERAKSLTSQLLTFSKGGSPQRRTIALKQLIIKTVQFASSGSNIYNIFSIPIDLWPCHVDENQIGQVIDNIVINAVQAMPGGGTLSVTAENLRLEPDRHALLHGGTYVKITISDTGVGIPKEMIRRIFDPFFSTKQKGSGLGLAIAYSIIKRHEGTIEVESQPGKGTSFSIYLPALPGINEARMQTFSRDYRDNGVILVMDDERFILEVASKMLSKMGFTPMTASTGNEAIEKVRQAVRSGTIIRAVILDLTIPGGKGGQECVRELLAIDPSIKAIVSSGYYDDPVMAEPEKHGFSGRLKKPYEMEQIKQVLWELLGSGHDEPKKTD